MGEQLKVRVTRTGETLDGSCWAAVEFAKLTAEEHERLRAVIALEQRLDTAPLVLVIDDGDEHLVMVAERLMHHSRHALLAKTFLMAVSCLNVLGQHIGLILVERGFAGDSSELLAYLREYHPSIHLAVYDELPSEEALRRLLDRTEVEAYGHQPWHCE
jgi:hypothetical protein